MPRTVSFTCDQCGRPVTAGDGGTPAGLTVWLDRFDPRRTRFSCEHNQTLYLCNDTCAAAWFAERTRVVRRA